MRDDTLAWMNELTAEMEERRKRVHRGGGEARTARQHAAGKLTARERLDALLDAGSFVGTRTFTLRYATIAANTNASLGLRNFGEVGVRFGIEPSSPRFQSVGYPGADGEAAAAHGHFVTVTASYGPARPVPEPASLALAGVALLMLGTRWSTRCSTRTSS